MAFSNASEQAIPMGKFGCGKRVKMPLSNETLALKTRKVCYKEFWKTQTNELPHYERSRNKLRRLTEMVIYSIERETAHTQNKMQRKNLWSYVKQ